MNRQEVLIGGHLERHTGGLIGEGYVVQSVRTSGGALERPGIMCNSL